MRINSFSSKFFCKGTTFDTSNFPIVNVPVLSNTIVVTLLEFSKAVRFLISNPFCADKVVDFATTNGTAKPKACGQQITITVTILSIENVKSFPAKFHIRKVVMPAAIAINVSHCAALSASNCVFDFDFCAS